MAKKRGSKKKKPKPKKRRRTQVWMVGRAELPLEGMAATMRVAFEQPSGFIVGSEVDEAEPGSLSELVLAAMEAPLTGPARRPDRIVMEDPVEAEQLRRELELAGHGDIDVVEGPVPVLARVAAEMLRFAEEGPPPPDLSNLSYLAEGVTREEVATLFEVASRIHDRQPWMTLNEDALFRIDAPTLGLDAACAMVIGRLGQSKALLLFPSFESYERFFEAANAGSRTPGTSILSLNFERAADLPRRMRKEAATHGWQVSTPDAYPWVQRRHASGGLESTRPIDVRIATALARALGAYLDARGEGPVQGPIELSSGEHRITIEGLENVLDEQEQDDAVTAAILNAADERFVDTLAQLVDTAFPQGLESGWAGVQMDWLAYEAVIEGRRLVDWFLDTEPPLSDEARALIEAQERAWFSLWEVVEAIPGESVELVDHLTGERRRVHDISTTPVRATILARVLDYDGRSVLAGAHERFVSPTIAADVVAAMRKRLRRKGTVPPERLRDPKTSLALMHIWRERVELADERRARPPQLQNTDGDPMLLTEDRFVYEQSAGATLRERLGEVEGMTTGDGGQWTLSRAGNAMHSDWPSTVLAHLVLDAGVLRVATNSIRRADEVRATLEDALGALIRFQARSHDDPTSKPALAAMAARPRETPKHPPEVAELLRSVKADHYATWPDVPVPALGGRTPREMVKTKKGREQVEQLLRQMQYQEALAPPEERFDMNTLRDELGLPRA